jgi:hypothetical protein
MHKSKHNSIHGHVIPLVDSHDIIDVVDVNDTSSTTGLPSTTPLAATRPFREKTVLKEREVIREGRPVLMEETKVTETTTQTGPAAMEEFKVVETTVNGVPTTAHVPSTGSGSSGAVRINPRTGKPITLPGLLSPHPPSPIRTEPPQEPQLIREEHEEVRLLS